MNDKKKSYKIGIVGTKGIGLSCAYDHYHDLALAKLMNEKDVIIVYNDKNNILPIVDETITINGVKYKERKELKRKDKYNFEGFDLKGYSGNDYVRERPNVNIESEFELIQNKQSKLCRNDRDWVVAAFNRKYKIIENNEG